MEKLIGLEVLWTSLKIKILLNQTNWDQSFVDYANSFDLIVIGGGNYFELVDKSLLEHLEKLNLLFEKIMSPVFFNALEPMLGKVLHLLVFLNSCIF